MGGGNPLKRVGNEVNRWGRQIDPTSSESLFGDTSNFFGNFNPASPDFAQMTGKGGGDYNSPAGNELAGVARQLFAETDPLRKGLISQSEDFLKGNRDVYGTPAYGALKQGAESQYGRARQNILQNTPGGGALTSALAGNEYAKAGTLTQGAGALYGDELNRATSLATGAPLTGALGGLGTAGSIQAQLAQAQATQNAASKQALGQGAGALGAYLKFA